MRLVADNGDAVTTESAEAINYFLALGFTEDKSVPAGEEDAPEAKDPAPKPAAKKAAAAKPAPEK